MTRSLWIGATIVALATVSAAVAQGTTTKAPVYKVKEEVVVKGTVTTVKAIPDWMGKDGVNLAIASPEASQPHVDVAPAAFLQMLDFPIVVGDELELTGYWGMAADGTPVFLVHQIKKQKTTLNVRDPGGVPLW
jgi:hypothetical protein